ncbi:MAG: tRNA (adenosine(37)-N6)-threonylcarbamoyltransferase complex dimerization subunit type 1 TsaB [Candidatus Eisenbacteria bacterium]
MIVLGIETSSRWSGVALAGPEGLLGEFHLQEGGRTEHLHLLTVRLFEAAGLAPGSIGGVAVSLGPGSFTGLRIGLAAAKGLALARGCPVVGIPLPPVLAEAALPWKGETEVWIDAGRGEAHGTLFRAGGETAPGRTARPEELLRRTGADEVLFVGNGAIRYREKIEEGLGPRALFLGGRRNYPDAARIALRGYARLAGGGEGDGVDDLEPLYLRGADAAKPAKGRRR